MKKILFAVILLFVLISGCIPSLHPIYNAETLVFRDELIGNWQSRDGDDEYRWQFEADLERKEDSWFSPERPGYRLTFSEDGSEKMERYEAHLVKLGEHYFIDFYPADEFEASLAFILPTHNFARVEFTEDGKVAIYLFDYDWLEKLFKERKIRIKHEKLSDGTYVLTASTQELQDFILKYADEEKAYLEPMVLERVGD